MQGMLLVDKPASWTSFDAVNYVRRLVATVEDKKPKHVKVGHTGTLDPFATGLLVLLIGKDYTRRAGEFSKLDKTYEVTVKLGETSTTGDPEGEITSVSDKVPTNHELETALENFKGVIQQTPPAYSAIKVNGQRAYKLARAGQEVVIEPRQVTINSLEITDYAYPEVKLLVDVSSGTYIRTLVEDLGKKLGTGAYTSALRRTTVGAFDIKKAVQVTADDVLTHITED
ncbi:MAG TPA: tRNA pseudouridine(55) synthase TruB [Candidatus Dormibacteraeota bacterium]|nr:tRNA pseudouridine(55) synthase TruB [Candidatus Dormibacteraeota bacterium]